jgi:hypothetical protein
MKNENNEEFFSIFCHYHLDHHRKPANDVWKGKKVEVMRLAADGNSVGERMTKCVLPLFSYPHFYEILKGLVGRSGGISMDLGVNGGKVVTDT